MPRSLQRVAAFLSVCAAALLPCAETAWSQVLIDQASAEAGNVTPGDAPGFPVTISQPGSDRLTSNLTVTSANRTVILVTASDVTIDLNGFRPTGPVGCSGPQGTCNANGTGVGVDGRSRTVTIVNGIVRGMGGTGVHAGPRSRVERLQVYSNAGFGIITAQDSLINDSTSSLNGAGGILAGNGSTVTGNVSTSNSGAGA